MKVSVIVPTYNRSAQIFALLESLEHQTFNDFEVIIINDGSTDNTIKSVNDYIKSTSLDINFFSVVNRGRPGARNYGIQKAKGSLLIFFDDDTRPNKDSVLKHVECHNKLDKILVSGPCLYDSSKFRDDFNHFRQWLEMTWTIKSEDLIPSGNLRINGGNFSIKKEHILKIGGFDERLKDKEDFKLSFDFKTKVQGAIYNYYPTWVYHDDFKGLKEYILRERSSRMEERKLAKLNSQIMKEFPERFNSKAPNDIKYKLGRILRLPVVLSFCVWLFQFAWLSRRTKNKVYDLIITMNVKYF